MNTEIDNKVISIPIDKYQEITGCNDQFENTAFWDEEHGIQIITNSTGTFKFKFKVIDPHRFFLAQIKYGL